MDLNPLHIINKLNDAIGHDTASVLEFLHITDPAVKPAGVREVGRTWSALGHAVDDANRDARAALQGVVWEGKAADAFAGRAQRVGKQADQIAQALHDGAKAINKFADIAESLIEQIGVIAAQMIEFEVAGLALSVITAGFSDAAAAIVTGERAMKIASLIARIEEEGGVLGTAIRAVTEAIRALRSVLEALKEVKGAATVAKLAKEGVEFTAFTTLLENPGAYKDPKKLTETLAEGALAGVGFGLLGKAVGKGLREISPAALADLARSFGKADDLAGLGKGENGLPGDLTDGLPPGDFLPYSGSDDTIDAPQSQRAADLYELIRQTEGDTARIAENTGINQGVLDRIKQHIFFTVHEDVPVGPGILKSGRFAPMDHIADMWKKAEGGSLDDASLDTFRRWAAHEGVESQLMADGIPYRSLDPAAWDEDGVYWPSAGHVGAHDLAPIENRLAPPFRLWGRLGVEPPSCGLADDLSNLDEIIAVARSMYP